MENRLLQELADMNQKMVKSYDTLSQIKDVEIAGSPKTEVYAEDKLRLYHYDRKGEATIKTPVLIVYALVNTYKMMDLQPDRSYIQNLLGLGLDVYLIDWGYPTKADRYLSM
ncbi:MAG: class III poly(R)-hydroxyalkanoic acid synthase subunit PhaC, partial [Bacteroidia bacterium]